MGTHLTHWGAFEAVSDGRSLTEVRPWAGDPEPSGILDNVASAQHHATRIDQPFVRAGWLDHGPGPAERGNEPFRPVSWETVTELLGGELRRVYDQHGAEAVYGGSYGWASAGRFHHAQSQLHRFLNCLGGYTGSVGTYSHGAAHSLLPHLIGTVEWVLSNATSWQSLAKHTELVVAFGGLSGKNSMVAPGGVARHDFRGSLRQATANGCRFVSITPLRDDTPAEARAEWIAPRPGTDTALMLALAYVLETEDLADRDFLRRCTVGYPRFADYLRGRGDGVARTPRWAAEITGVPEAVIHDLAVRMARSRTLVTVSLSLQRTRFGEQPLWAGLNLAAMLGQIGTPGGGFGHGYGSVANVGRPQRVRSAPSFGQGRNPVSRFIPVARIADMLLHPGDGYDFNGRRLSYPDIRLVYWCGGNPFHHHQDLARLRTAFARPDTVVVHDPFWTATARHADIVLPTTMSIERDDFGAGSNDPVFLPMPALTEPHAQARDDYAIFAALAGRLGVAAEFTEGLDPVGWLRRLYTRWAASLPEELPGFDEFWNGEPARIPVPDPEQVFLRDFRADPERHPLRTPSGRIEIFSETIAGFGYPDCPGHPVWLEPEDWLGGERAARWPLHLVANQPVTRLHSQLDVGAHSRGSKIAGREPLRMHPADAAERGLGDGDLIRVFNDRGSCLAGLRVSEELRPGVVQLSTGAWYDPDPADPRHCRHGNPNVLTADEPTSRLGQACSGQHALVQVERYAGTPPELAVLRAPEQQPGPAGDSPN